MNMQSLYTILMYTKMNWPALLRPEAEGHAISLAKPKLVAILGENIT